VNYPFNSCDGKAEFSVSFLQSPVSHDPSEIIYLFKLLMDDNLKSRYNKNLCKCTAENVKFQPISEWHK